MADVWPLRRVPVVWRTGHGCGCLFVTARGTLPIRESCSFCQSVRLSDRWAESVTRRQRRGPWARFFRGAVVRHPCFTTSRSGLYAITV